MPETISNTSPLLYLHQLGQLDLLRELYGRILVPVAVASELVEGVRRGHSVPVVADLPWAEVVAVAQDPIRRLIVDLDAGEREVIALALERPGCRVILDDAAARRHASVLGLQLTGTLGVLVRAKSHGLLLAVEPVLDRLQTLGFRIAPGVRDAILRRADER